MFSLQGKSTLITGGGRGIGFAIYLSGRNATPLEKACADLASRFGVEAHPLIFDVADKQAVRAAIDEVKARRGELNILVNNAGVNKSSAIGACAVFLASSGADYITGQTIVVDGGFLNSF